MTNNLKAERTLTALNHVARVEHALEEAMHGVHNSQEWGEAWTGTYADGHHSYAAWIEAEFAELKAAIQSLSTQQPMGEVTDEMVELAAQELLAHGEFSSIPWRNHDNAIIAARSALEAALHPNQESGE